VVGGGTVVVVANTLGIEVHRTFCWRVEPSGLVTVTVHSAELFGENVVPLTLTCEHFSRKDSTWSLTRILTGHLSFSRKITRALLVARGGSGNSSSSVP
jgi:hypothetical protein